ncbi:MAG: hypothetical protein IK134_01535 [Oscillospiraceae bacterium]|nr:hypothetical protein [Oscillospiraceae bacterium]
MKKTTLGSVAVTFDRNQINALLQMLHFISVADTENMFATDAVKLKEKIIKHGRTYQHKDTDGVSLFFYDNEAGNLIRLTALFLSSVLRIEKDYYPEIGRIHKKGLGIPKTAEQNISGQV